MRLFAQRDGSIVGSMTRLSAGELSTSSGIEREILESVMGFGRGFLLWILGIPLPIILLLALFWR